MDRKKIIILIIAAAAILLFSLLLWLFWPKQEMVDINTNVNQPEGAAPQSLEQLPPASPERQAQERNYPLGLRELAFSFAERYGSYSSDEPFKNLDDLKIVMTDKMIASAESVGRSQTLGQNGYEGYDSWALASELRSYGEDQATILVQVQRVHYLGETQDTFNQGLLLQFVKVENEWRVDEAAWQ